MLPDYCTPRRLVRKRIIYRNVNPWILKGTHILGGLTMLLLFPVGFMAIADFIPFWTFPATMTAMILFASLYTIFWFKMINSMKNSTRDKKFVNKMLKMELW